MTDAKTLTDGWRQTKVERNIRLPGERALGCDVQRSDGQARPKSNGT